MKFKKINKILIFLLFCSSSVFAEKNNKISYLDINFLLNDSLAGKSILLQLNEIDKKNKKKFTKETQLLKSEEDKIISQKNVINESDFKKKVQALRVKVKKFKDTRNKLINDLNIKKINAESELIRTLTPILGSYLEANNISIVIQKKNIIIGRADLDITKDIVKILDQKVKKIKLK